MKLFHRRSKGIPKGMDRVEKTLLEARMDRIESDLRNIRSEWAELYEKIMHLYDRIRKREKVVQVVADSPAGDSKSKPSFETGADVLKHYRSVYGH